MMEIKLGCNLRNPKMDVVDHSRLMAKNKIRWMEFKPS
jgi:hypothetical protein